MGRCRFRWRHAYSVVTGSRYPSSRQIVRQAHVLGGSAVSSSPEAYPEFDCLHLGEIGDATDELIAALDESLERPAAQRRFETRERLPLSSFPLPLYDAVATCALSHRLAPVLQRLPVSVRILRHSGPLWPQPRFKSHEQLLAELDAFISQPDHPPVFYLVDDNFIGNRKAARDLLPHLIDWQKRHGYPLQFACEATLNIAKQTDILALMRDAGFLTVFVGIETPEF